MSQQIVDKAIECDNKKPSTDTKVYIHSAIGIGIMLVFYLVALFAPETAYAPITPVGMKALVRSWVWFICGLPSAASGLAC